MGEIPFKLYTGKKGPEMKRWLAAGENSSGFTNEQSLLCGVFSGICWTKSQRGGGGGGGEEVQWI